MLQHRRAFLLFEGKVAVRSPLKLMNLIMKINVNNVDWHTPSVNVINSSIVLSSSFPAENVEQLFFNEIIIASRYEKKKYIT